MHEPFAEFGGDLQGVYAQRQEDLDLLLDVLLFHVFLEVLLVGEDHGVGEKLCALGVALIDDGLMVFSQLNLIVLHRVKDALIAGHFLDRMQHLQQADSHREYLPARLQNLLILLLLLFKLLLELRLSLALAVGLFENGQQPALAGTGGGQLPLLEE